MTAKKWLFVRLTRLNLTRAVIRHGETVNYVASHFCRTSKAHTHPRWHRPLYSWYFYSGYTAVRVVFSRVCLSVCPRSKIVTVARMLMTPCAAADSVKKCFINIMLSRITDRSFCYASPGLWDQLLPPFLRQPHCGISLYPTHQFIHNSLCLSLCFTNPPRSFTSTLRTTFTDYIARTVSGELSVFLVSLLLARLMGQYCFSRWRRSSSVTRPPGAWAVGRPTLHDGPITSR